ncbi:hypothetical protein C0V77_07200 [Emticicia sp. TH156]|nr:hypothetical protein C0V77_07200 [Emticicia sp. TH156]
MLLSVEKNLHLDIVIGSNRIINFSPVKIGVLSLALLLVFSGGFAQRRSSTPPPVVNKPDSKKTERKKEDYKMLAYGLTTNTNSGLLGGFVVRHSKSIGTYKWNPVHQYIAFEAVNIKNNKERSEPTIIANRIIYGKTNYLFSLRPQYGREIVYFRKNGEDGIGISVIAAVGPSLGLQKPYYIKYDRDGKGAVDVVQFDPNIHTDFNRIQGSAGIWQGLFTSMKVIPGAHAKLAANIDINTFGNNMTGFEVGLTAEYFSKTPEIMSNQLTTNSRFYTAGYLTIYFGSKKQSKTK